MKHLDHFEQIIDRRNTSSGKWDTMDKKYESKELIHLGVADMDFQSPPAICQALSEVAFKGIYGYTDLNDKFYEGIQRWYQKQYQLDIPGEWIVFCPRINTSSSICVESCTEPGAGVVIHTPAYTPLKNAIIKNGRQVIASPLVHENGGIHMDMEALEAVVDENTQMLILCSPHNPTTRIWNKEELEQIAEFCERHDMILYSDEIHGDVTAEGKTHISALGLSEQLDQRLILASSPTKTFNIPGVIISYMIIPNEEIRRKIAGEIDRIGMHNPSIFAQAAFEEAYLSCDDWYEDMKEYINGNDRLISDFLERYFPGFVSYPREGSYLLWVDYRKTGKTEQELEEWFLNHAKVSVYMGSVFGAEGDGFFRVNLAAPRTLLEQACRRMMNAINYL